MKGKKLFAILLVIAMMFSMSVTALADNLAADGSITITNATKDTEYEAYKIFDLTYSEDNSDAVLGLTDNKFHKTASNAALLAAMQGATGLFVVTPEQVDDGTGTMVDSTTDFTVELVSGKTEADVREFLDTHAALLPKTNVSYTYTKKGTNDTFFTALTGDDSLFTLTEIPGHAGQYTVELKDADTTGKEIGEWLADEEIEPLVKANCAKYTPTTTPTAADGEVTIGNLPYGYYYVTSSLGSVVTVDSTLKNVKVVDKNQGPDWDDPDNDDDTPDDGKYILEGTDRVKVNEASIGDTINFVIPIDATNYNGTNTITDYTITDSLPDGMTFNKGTKTSVADNIEVYVDGTKLTALTATEIAATGYEFYSSATDGKYIITMDEDGQGFTIEIPWANKVTEEIDEVDVTTAYVPKSTDSNRLIEVKYSVTLNEKAVAGDNVNTATFTWKEIPDEDPEGNPHDPHYDDPEDPNASGTKPTSSTRTLTDQLTINKVDKDGNKLTGAEFSITGASQNIVVINGEIFVNVNDMPTTNPDYVNIETSGTPAAPVIYYMLNDGTYTTTAPTGTAGEDTEYASVTDTFYKVIKVDELEKDAAKDYQAAGYVNSNGVLTFKGLGAGEYTITEEVAPKGYNLLTEPIKIKVVLEEVEDPTTHEKSQELVIYKWDPSLNSGAGDYEAEPMGNDIVEMDVVNNQGAELPATGGIGTTIFYIAGGVLLIGAAILLITKKRMNAND